MTDQGSPDSGIHSEGAVVRAIRRAVDVRPEEVAAVAWSWLYFFCILSSYYVLRPIRDEMGVAGGVENLPWLFTGTLIGMLVANPPFAALVSRLPRRQFVSLTYRFFMANILVFYLLLEATTGSQNVWVGRVFFIWTSVFNLFVVSVFWAFMVDVFTTAQGKRLFGFIGAGGTLGSIMGSSLTAGLAGFLGPTNLLLVSIALLELGVFAVRRLSRLSERLRERAVSRVSSQEVPIGGGVLTGVTNALKSPYLVNISVYMLLFTILSTFLYFQQADIVNRSFSDRATRTTFFAQVDLLVNVLTLGTQLFVTGRMVKALGVALALTFLPALSLLGFAALGLAPTIAVIVLFQVVRRAGNFAVARPTREVLFTVLPREDRYKAKSFIDTFVYRAGDQVGAWSYALMGVLGLGMAGISGVAVVLSAGAVANALWLGRRQDAMAAERRNLPQQAAPAGAPALAAD